MWLILIISSIFLASYLWIRNYYNFFRKHNFPFVKPHFPLGSAPKLGRTECLSEVVRREYESFKDKGPAFGIFIFTRPLLMVTDLELIKDILLRDFDNFHSFGVDYENEHDSLSRHLILLKGLEWKILRDKLSPAFTSGKIKMMLPIMEQISDRLISHLMDQAEDEIDFHDLFTAYLTESTTNIAFGLDTKCIGNADNQFRQIVIEFLNPKLFQLIKTTFIVSFPRLARAFDLKMVPEATASFLRMVVKENIEYRQVNNVYRGDLFQFLMSSSTGISFDEIVANCFLFLAAGVDSTATTLTFLAYELALNQDIQQRLRCEIEDVLEKFDGKITFEAMNEMKYLDMTFKETLRKYPLLESHPRKTERDYKIKKNNLVIPAGTIVAIPVIGLHMDERYFPEPEKFDPERFTDENMRKRHSMTFQPFSDGQRHCIGKKLAEKQVKLVIIKLFRSFKVSPCEKTLIPMKFKPTSFIQCPVNGMWLKIKRI